jgi:hypothetical protein
MTRVYDNDEWERRQAERPSKTAADHMNAVLRGQPVPGAADDGEEEDEDEDLTPAARVGAGTFDGGAGLGQRFGEPPDPLKNLELEMRGALTERRLRRIELGGG